MAVFKPQGAALEVDSATKEPDDYTVENTSLDLDAISQSYSGLMKIKRLLHIARHCPMLALDATQHAVEEVRSTFNIGAFQVCNYTFVKLPVIILSNHLLGYLLHTSSTHKGP